MLQPGERVCVQLPPEIRPGVGSGRLDRPSVPANPVWPLAPIKAHRLRQIAGRVAVGIEDDVVDDEAIAFAAYT